MAVVREKLKGERVETRSWLGSLLVAAMYVLAFAALYLLIGQALTWAQRKMDDVRYGYPRGVHLSETVSYADGRSMHTYFVALNLEGQMSVLEIPDGDTTQVKVLQGPYLFGANGKYEVPNLEMRDVDSDGLTDLLLTIEDEVVVYVNRDGGFRTMTPEERVGFEEAQRSGGNTSQ